MKFQKLTRPNIRALLPGETITEHGIIAQKLPDGDVKFSVNIMVDGRRIHRIVGKQSEETTRSQCEDFIVAARSSAKSDRLDLPNGRKVAMTVAKAADLYLAAMQETGGKNRAAKKQHIEAHMKPYMGKMTVQRVSVFTLGKFRKNIIDKGLAEATANRVAATWNHMQRWLDDNNKLSRPLPRMRTTTESNRRDFIFSAEAESKILAAAAKDAHPHIWLFLKMGFATSMRHSEILSARFENLDEGRRRLRVKVKGGRWRDQPLPKALVDVLRAERKSAPDKNGWIFPSDRTSSGRINQISGAFRRCAVAAGLDPDRATPHTMRHTAISRFSAAVNGDAAMVKMFSGHLSVQMVLRYTHPSDERIDRALRTMSGANVISLRKRKKS